MADPEWLLLESVTKYPNNTALFYSIECRFNPTFVNKALYVLVRDGKLETNLNEDNPVYWPKETNAP